MSKTFLLFSFSIVSSIFLYAIGPDLDSDATFPPLAPVIASIVPDTIPPIQDRTIDFINAPKTNPFDLKDPAVIEKNVEYDVETGQYIITEKLGDDYFRAPTYMSFQEYMDYRAKEQEKSYFNSLAGVNNDDDNISGRIDPISKLKSEIENNLVNRLFGGTEVSIQPQGNIDLTFGGFYQNNENPTLDQRRQRQGGFDFDMDIQMNVRRKDWGKTELINETIIPKQLSILKIS